ncbi:MAG TPA: hypothetical protein VF834_15170 [Streptosporangiaceae bacterium]
MRLEILHVPDCPNTAVLEERLAAILPDYPAVQVSRHVVTTEAEAQLTGMTGSPTILANGIDPFARHGQRPSLSCRIYQDERGNLGAAPTIEQLTRILAGDPA